MGVRRATILAAMLGALALGFAPFSIAEASGVQCWKGYHKDRRGDCQPDNPIPDDRCPPGMITQVYPNWLGYICVPIPRGY